VSEAESNLLRAPDEVPVAAAIVIDDKIISLATNTVQRDNSPFCHAEFLCLTEAVRVLNTKYLNTASIYVTLEPCPFCASALDKVRIKNIYFGAYDQKGGGIFNGPRIFDYSKRKVNIVGGIMEERCSLMMSNFFKNIRKK
jgi:tRNA(adenine34) deaminase